MRATLPLDNPTVTDDLAALVDHDPATADRDLLGELMSHARRLRGFLDAYDIACARRSKELAAQGASEDAYTLFLHNGTRSAKDAHQTDRREGVCSELPEFEHALAAGEVSTHHLDTLGKLTKDLSDAERLDLKDRVTELLDSAKADYVERFEKNAKAIITEIKDQHRPDSDLEELDRQRRDSNVTDWVDRRTGMRKTLIELDPIRHEHWWRIYNDNLNRLRQQPGTKNLTWQQLKVEAFLATARATIDSNGAGTTPTPAAAPAPAVPKAIVIIDEQTLREGRHPDTVAELTDGTPVPIGTIREMLCDADIVPAVLGGQSQPLDVGRARRLATPAQRDALRATYTGCVYPGCDTTFDDCKIHHIRPFEPDGLTNLDNEVPVCEAHHHAIHEGGWHVATDHHRTITWTRPDGTTHYHGPGPKRRRPRPDPP